MRNPVRALLRHAREDHPGQDVADAEPAERQQEVRPHQTDVREDHEQRQREHHPDAVEKNVSASSRR
jgi:hypothetical protein